MKLIKRIKQHWVNLLIMCVFIIGIIFAVIAMAQTLRPINSIIDSNRRIADVVSAETSRQSILDGIKPFIKIRSVYLIMYLCVIVFFIYMAVIRFIALFNKKAPAFILPLLALINTILLVIVMFQIKDFNIGLGLIPPAESMAGGYTWYTPPYMKSSSYITYFAPTFWTVIFPMIFLGVLPLINGIKRLLT
jgi:hypothetical protein